MRYPGRNQYCMQHYNIMTYSWIQRFSLLQLCSFQPPGIWNVRSQSRRT